MLTKNEEQDWLKILSSIIIDMEYPNGKYKWEYTEIESMKHLALYHAKQAVEERAALFELYDSILWDGLPGDCEENYTNGYKFGHRNGQLELIERLLHVPGGSCEEYPEE